MKIFLSRVAYDLYDRLPRFYPSRSDIFGKIPGKDSTCRIQRKRDFILFTENMDLLFERCAYSTKSHHTIKTSKVHRY